MTDEEAMKILAGYPILGVRYNVVRRPLSGGKGTIVQHKATAGAKCPKCNGNCRRPVSPGGLNTVCQKCHGFGRVNAKPAETEEAFYGRVSAIIKGSPEEYFMRWKVEVSPADVQRFRRECLDPILEQLCQWWDWMNNWKARGYQDVFADNLHWRHPYGCFNPLNEGGASELDEYLATGSMGGLAQVDNLFPELP